MRGLRRWAACLALALLAACAGEVRAPAPSATPSLALVHASYQDLPGWSADDAGGALAAFRATCAAIPARLARSHYPGFGTAADWQPACAAAAAVPPSGAKSFFVSFFAPYQAVDTAAGPDGLFTAYYQPELHGSRHSGDRYTVPLYRRPADLVSVDLGAFRPEYQGRRLAGRLVGNRLLPYPTRAAIEDGALGGQGLELVWVDSAIDAFFLAVQGSGRVILDDGSVLPVAYDGDNGQAYVSIGRVLAAEGIPADSITLPYLKQYLAQHPADAKALMDRNPAYVFFKRAPGSGAAIGASGAALTPSRSIAVDPAFVPYGVPAWIDAADAAMPGGRFDRLMVAQDTGGAIRGPVRADIFAGTGSEAERHAGQMKGRGRWWLLLPKSVPVR